MNLDAVNTQILRSLQNKFYFSQVVNPDIANQYKHIISKLYNHFVYMNVLYVFYVFYLFLWYFCIGLYMSSLPLGKFERKLFWGILN